MQKNMMLVAVIVAVAIFSWLFKSNQQNSQVSNPTTNQTQVKQGTSSQQDDTAKIQHYFQQRQSNIQVHATGRVKAVLKDDNKGSRHQKFILELSQGQTVLVAHNIDLSERLPNLQKGDMVEFYGEYEYSEQGGVIHWTHHDPQGRHENGWLKYQGKMYQ